MIVEQAADVNFGRDLLWMKSRGLDDDAAVLPDSAPTDWMIVVTTAEEYEWRSSHDLELMDPASVPFAPA